MSFRDVAFNAAPVRRVVVLATVGLAATPLLAAASPSHDGTRATTAAAKGVAYGGVTPDGFGLVVEVNKSRRKVVRMATGLRMQCTAGSSFSVPDSWTNLRISKRRFGATFGPITEPSDDGTTTTFEGSVSGRFNSSRTTVSGTWSLKLTQQDAAGAVMDICDSGVVTWSAKQ